MAQGRGEAPLILSEKPPEAHFTRPARQFLYMMITLGLVVLGVVLGWNTLRIIVLANPYLNAMILIVFVIGIASCFYQVSQLLNSVKWIEGFVAGKSTLQAPSLLAPLATLLRSRGARTQISSSSSRSILDSVASRIDEDREITRYISNTLIFLGLLGTFYGLATTVPALMDTIRSLSPQEGESGQDVFVRLQSGLEAQLGGMGTAFSSSLLGLAASLIVGLLELFASQGQNRFYRELEEWLSSITRLGLAASDEGGVSGQLAGAIEVLAEQMESLQLLVSQSEQSRMQTQAALQSLAASEAARGGEVDLSETNALLRSVSEGQTQLIAKLDEGGLDGLDAESRMRLRSMDEQLLRVLEEMIAGRQETQIAIHNDLNRLARVITQAKSGQS